MHEAGGGPERSGNARNLLFITADQWRGECLSTLGHLVRTPNLDALAAQGTLFTRHFANTVPCGPSRASIHTGMYQQNHRVVANGAPLDARHGNWALLAREAGGRIVDRQGRDADLFTPSVILSSRHLIDRFLAATEGLEWRRG